MNGLWIFSLVINQAISYDGYLFSRVKCSYWLLIIDLSLRDARSFGCRGLCEGTVAFQQRVSQLTRQLPQPRDGCGNGTATQFISTGEPLRLSKTVDWINTK